MAVKRPKKRRDHDSAEQKKRKRALIAAQLAPAEEQTSIRHHEFQHQAPVAPRRESEEIPADEAFVDGSVILDGAHFHLPPQVVHQEGELSGSPFNPVLIVVLTISLGFTAFIAYLITVEAS